MSNTVSESDYSSRQRLFAGAIAIASFSALAVQPALGEGSYMENLGAMLRFFTIWGNVGACIVMAAIAFGLRVSPKVLASLATMLAVIALVYWGLLAGEHHPTGADRVTNQFHHTIIPAAVIAWWFAFTPPSTGSLGAVPAIMVPPLSYGAFAVVLGELTGFYAYFFLDPPSLGWGQFLINNVVLAAFFALLGAGLVALKRRFGRSA
ncbi:Pr6Pr family membrane protein [uncultured Erythrobacter sp.]|uniref:Pr6Pr family membrane protein n=1 Tax=uncultured Erythrobacter sp. TaxID=263913 RepID=UPI00262F0BB8|nr:Pr6Pr family membrane protein [uncultured Erythrobacter sp.]